MMRHHKILFAFFLLCTDVCARGVTDTLKSTKNDKVYITYDITQNNGDFTIRFVSVQKSLGRTHKNAYKLDKVDVAFFDRIGKYDKTEFSGANTQAFMVPSEVDYKRSADGYFLLKQKPSLSVKLNSSDPVELKIPVFLVYYEKKQRYKVLCGCEPLVVKLTSKAKASPAAPTVQQTTQTVTTQEEVETGLTEEEEAAILIERIEALLEQQDGPEFSFELKQAISGLSNLKVKDRRLSAQINEVLMACGQKQKELEDIAKEIAERKAAEEAKILIERIYGLLKLQEPPEFTRDLQESISRLRTVTVKDQGLSSQIDEVLNACTNKENELRNKAREIAEREAWQNRLLMIGGAILALLTFVGGKVFQQFQNKKNEKRWSEMQEAAIKKAEAESKKRARDMIRKEKQQMEGNAKKAVRDFTKQTGKGNKGNGNKKVTI